MVVCITQQLVVKTLLNRLGPSYSKGLGIDLSGGDDGEIFKWFLASLLYGARILESIASRTFKQLVEDGLSTPWSIAQASWAKIVYSLDRGGYVRHDFKTASKLQQASTSLIERYGGSLNYLHWVAKDERDLEARIRGLEQKPLTYSSESLEEFGQRLSHLSTSGLFKQLRTWAS